MLNDFRFYFKPAAFYEAILRMQNIVTSGNTPFYEFPDLSDGFGFRGDGKAIEALPVSLVFNLENRFNQLYSFNIGLFTFDINLILFADAAANAVSYDSLKRWNYAAGCGLELLLAEPINLPVRLNYGYDFERGGLWSLMTGIYF